MTNAVAQADNLKLVGEWQPSTESFDPSDAAWMAKMTTEAVNKVKKELGLKSTKKTEAKDENPSDSKRQRSGKPKFLTYATKGKNLSEKYKVGDTKTHNNETYQVCDCPNHKGGVHWHKLKAEECRTCKKWLADKGNNSGPKNNNDGNKKTQLQAKLGEMLQDADNDKARAHIAELINLAEDN